MKKWSEAEVAELKRVYSVSSIPTLEKIFKRTYSSVRCKASKLGLHKKIEFRGNYSFFKGPPSKRKRKTGDGVK